MKKLILILFTLILGLFLFVGCEEENPFRNDLILTLQQIKLQEENLGEYIEVGNYIGSANIIIYEEEEFTLANMDENGTAILFSVEIGDCSLNYFFINEIIINYINQVENLSIDLTYYNATLIGRSIIPYKMTGTIDEFRSNLLSLDIKDWEFILKELGY